MKRTPEFCTCGYFEVAVLERMVESRVEPGLYFDLVQQSFTYGGKILFPSTPTFQLLTLLEINGGYAGKEEALNLCWAKKNSATFVFATRERRR